MSDATNSDEAKARILVVDDTPSNLHLLVKVLKKNGYVVHPADSGQVALRFLETELPDIILLDVMMPGMDGFRVCERLKDDPRTRDIPVIFLSAADHLLDKVRAFGSGGVDYVVKPFEIVEVLARIETHLLLRGLQKDLEERVRERTHELVDANAKLNAEISERSRAQERFFKVFHSSPTPMVVTRAKDGICVDVNEAAIKMCGSSREDLVGRSWVANGLTDTGQLEQALKMSGGQDVVRGKESILRLKGGEMRVFLCSIEGIDLDGEACRISTYIDITERKQAEEALWREEERFRYVSLATRDAIYDWGIRGNSVSYNEAYRSLFAPNDAAAAQRVSWEERIHPDDRQRVIESLDRAFGEKQPFWSDEYRFLRSDGGCAAILDRGYILYDADTAPMRMIGALTDMTELRRSEERLNYVAHHDLLTGLPNRALLLDRLRQAIFEANRHGRLVAVMFLDLDRFKTINDTLGHAAGDLLLKEVARRVSESVREGDTVARLSGDEFALVLSDIAQIDDAARLAQKILDVFAKPFHVDPHVLFVTASLGMALCPHDGSDPDLLLRNADVAMYRSKDSGRNAYHFYTKEMTSKFAENLALENELHEAFERGELSVYYQPVVDAVSGALISLEALVRWQHPRRGMVSPNRFIPIAEESGLIVPLGEWALREAAARCRRWQREALPGLRIAVNLSPRQFRQKDFARRVRDLVEESGLDPASLELEITEGLLLNHDAATLETLRALADMGAELVVDDFGTGYSSLAYLRRFPVTSLKIDQSFIRDIPADRDAAAIAQAIISMAHALGLRTTAEGIETREQQEFLRTYHCDAFQGNWFCQPIPAADVLPFLQTHALTKRAR